MLPNCKVISDHSVRKLLPQRFFVHAGTFTLIIPVMKDSSLHTSIVNSLDIEIAVIDQDGIIVDVNSAWIKHGTENGISAKFVWIGSNYLNVLSESAASGDNSAGDAANGITDVLRGKRSSFNLEYPCHSPDKKRWFMMRVSCLRDGSGNLFVISHHNITQRKLAEERAERLAMNDPLTGLANRRYFNEFLKREVLRGNRNRSAISLLIVDVDKFKDYNDEYGHPAGDQCLIEVGQALLALSRRPSDLAVRLGGDEFALILGNTDRAGAQKVAEAIITAIADLGMSYGESRNVTVSVGLASMVPQTKADDEILVQEADKALYRAKSAGGNKLVTY